MESRSILHIFVIADDLANHSLNLPKCTSIHPGGPHCLLSNSLCVCGARGFEDPKCHLPAAVGIGTECLSAFSAPADGTNNFHQCTAQVRAQGLKVAFSTTAEEQNGLTSSISSQTTGHAGNSLFSTVNSSRCEKSSVCTLHRSSQPKN